MVGNSLKRGKFLRETKKGRKVDLGDGMQERKRMY